MIIVTLVAQVAGGFIAVTGRWKCISSAQSENLCNLKIALCILRILRLCSNLEIAQHVHNLRTLNFAWQWVINCVACKMKDILDTCMWHLPPLATYCNLGDWATEGFEMFCAKQYRVVLVHLHDILQLYSCIYSCYYVFACILCASHRARRKFNQMKWRSTIETMPVLSSAYPLHCLASEVNRSGADAQVVSSCHHYLVIFHPFVEQLANHLLYQLS